MSLMELREFHGQIYGKYTNQLYILEPTWDSFRPIVSVAWNGERFVVQDTRYKVDLFSPHYGYESIEQKKECLRLIQETELGSATVLTDPIEFWKWCGVTTAKWWRDRPCVFTDGCVPKDILSWKKYLHYLNVRAKTLRRTIYNRKVTKRLVAK